MRKDHSKLVLLLLIFVLVFSTFPLNVESQTWENEYGKLEVYPNISHELITQKQFYNVTWYYPDNDLDIAFRFNESLFYGSVYFFNGSSYNKVSHNHIEYNDKHYYVLNNIHFVQEEMKHGYWEYNTPINSSGKWDMFVKLNSDSWQYAFNNNRYIHLDPWWNSTWDYSKCTDVCNAVTDYQVKVTVGKTSSGDINCSGNCQDDFDDIRFTKGDNSTELHYWRESYTSGISAIFWVNISDASSVCMYYGNNVVSTTSNGTNTFLYFDDWASDNTGDWWSFTETAAGGTDTANNVLNITGGVGYEKRLRYRHTMEYWDTTGTGASFRIGYCSNEWDVTYQYPDDWIGTLTTASSGVGSGPTAQAWNVYHDVDGSTGGTAYEVTDPFSPTSYYVRDYTLLSNSATSKQYDDSGNLLDIKSETDVADIPPAADLDDIVMFTYTDNGGYHFEHDAVNGELIVGGNRTTTANVFSIDWMFLSKYAGTESTFCDWSGEYKAPHESIFLTNPIPTNNSEILCLNLSQLCIDVNFSCSSGNYVNITLIHNGNITYENDTTNIVNGTYYLNFSSNNFTAGQFYIWWVNSSSNCSASLNNGYVSSWYNFTCEIGCDCYDEFIIINYKLDKIQQTLDDGVGGGGISGSGNIIGLIGLFGLFGFIGYISGKRKYSS